jgi:hypothetical protein
MLHHRSLNPVLIRDWSPKPELSAGALDVSASVSFEARRTINGAEQHRTEYLRPAPVSAQHSRRPSGVLGRESREFSETKWSAP